MDKNKEIIENAEEITIEILNCNWKRKGREERVYKTSLYEIFWRRKGKRRILPKSSSKI